MALITAGLAFLALSGESKSGQESAEFSATAMIAFESTLVGTAPRCSSPAVPSVHASSWA